MEFGYVCSPSRITFANALFSVLFNIGGFLASPFAALVAGILGTSPRAPLIAGAVVLVVVTIVSAVFMFVSVRKQSQQKQDQDQDQEEQALGA